MLFYTNSAKHLTEKINIPKGKFVIKKFSDGEIYVKVETDVEGKPVWVIGSTNAPADNLLELFLLINALQREGAEINLFIPYFGYARQGNAEKGEALSLEVMANFFNIFKFNKLLTLHLHNDRLKDFLNFENVIPTDLYIPIVKNFDCLVAPDQGANELIDKLAEICACEKAFIEKRRPEQDQAEVVKFSGNVTSKKVIIVDDVVSTGGTIIEAAKSLAKEGAKQISAIVTHGIFSGNAVADIENSPIEEIFVTNSINQTKKLGKIKVLDIAPTIENLIR